MLEMAFMEDAVVSLLKKLPLSQAKVGASSDNRLQPRSPLQLLLLGLLFLFGYLTQQAGVS